MSYIETFIPGQISMSNYAGDVAQPSTTAWDYGQYTKIEDYQYNYALASNHTHMPNPYDPNSTAHANTIFGELDRKQWLKGILMEFDWGRIETSPGVWNWTFTDFVFNTIRGLQRATGKNKKVLILVNMKHIALSGLDQFLPSDLLTQPSANGGYYKDPAAFPPSQTDPIINAKKYDHAWCYEGFVPSPSGGGVGEPKGYNFNYHKFTAAAGTNTLKTRFYAFLQAIANRYGNDSVFAGIITTEAAIGAPFVAYESGNGRNQNFEGRLNIAKYMKTLFPNHLVAECVNFDRTYYQDMTNAGVTDGLIANRLAFTTANYHLGTNMNLGNINPVLVGNIPIIMQIQPLDMRTMSGNRSQYYNWPTNPTQILSGDGTNYNDPPTIQWLWDRLKYFNPNYAIIQRNMTAGQQSDWNGWKAFMDASAFVNDPGGGMIGTKPRFIV